ncbi:MAG: hypothetical protein OEU36_25520, partial [Gammaproteobacteria bacterium]|nr:hypothetical protein [Gammaproteobacteria bacterium]
MKKKSFGVSLIGMLILSIETIQPAAAAEDTSDPERGANLIESRCSDCHTSESLIPAVQAHPETERAEFL